MHRCRTLTTDVAAISSCAPSRLGSSLPDRSSFRTRSPQYADVLYPYARKANVILQRADSSNENGASAIPLTHRISRSQGYCEAQQDQPVFVCHSVDELGWCWICADEFSCLCAAQQSLRKVRPIMRPWLLGLDSVGDEDGFGHVNGRSFALSSVQPRHVQTAGSRICFGRGCFGLSEQI